ncbi:hypothetical protein ABK040_001176 [Willaertia magna]
MLSTRFLILLKGGKPKRKKRIRKFPFYIILYIFLLILGLESNFNLILARYYNPIPNITTFFSETPRRWIVAGNFTSISVNSTIYSNLNNIAVWNGKRWLPFGNGTDGAVNSVFFDTCFSLWVGGKFKRAGGIDTGPIARYSLVNSKWESISKDVSWVGDQNIVNSVTVDCYNTPGEFSKCMCNVWMGGHFRIQFKDGQVDAVNVAMYQLHTGKWFSLRDSTTDHNLTISDVVNTVYKRDFGQTFSSRYTFVGGNFNRLLLWHPLYKWSSIDIKDKLAKIYDIGFHKSIFDNSFFGSWNHIVVGDFLFETNTTSDGNNITCSNICFFNFKYKYWDNVLSDPYLINKPIKQFSTLDNTIYAVGDFDMPDYKYFVIINGNGINNKTIPTGKQTTKYKSVYVCKEIDLDCKKGSAGLVDERGDIWFFDIETSELTLFGTANEFGFVNIISSIYLYYLDNLLK